ncbi:magnesium transporter CorA family protein [Catellatospora citrea]|uniref:Magnesium transporter CorA n=1 Tax=Catellatospora citrea TaxID=53366 RepID=A0A8J3KJ93_9ACTN|nr:magnesium transporter CorA family protein [Catellatospora citrea]RKE05263.1 magnesium transporter [Catellatospora citrea]GIF98193.1 magnesium transporter CorA [Catellatospora citrea]
MGGDGGLVGGRGGDRDPPESLRRARTRLYRDGVCALEDFPVDDVAGHLADPATVIWLDLYRPSAEDMSMLATDVGLHELAIGECLDKGQRPSLNRYPEHLSLDAYGAALDPESSALMLFEIAVFCNDRVLITVRKDCGLDLEPVVAGWDASPEQTRRGVAFLLYGLLDHIVNGQFQAVRQLDEAVDDLEEQLFDARGSDAQSVQQRLFQLRRDLIALRRVVKPMEEVVESLLSQDVLAVGGAMAPYYQKLYDHAMRAADWTDALHDLAATTMQTNLITQANRLNTIMKKVTSWAAIIAVPTAITGFYGQNLPYPGYGSTWGMFVSTGLIAVLSVLLYTVFKRNDWL